MHDMDTRNKFVELRAKGISLARIASRLKVSKRTLVDWGQQEQENIRALRAIELEAMQERILVGREHELLRMRTNLDRIEEQIAERTHKFESLPNLYRMAALVRAEIRKMCDSPDLILSGGEAVLPSPIASGRDAVPASPYTPSGRPPVGPSPLMASPARTEGRVSGGPSVVHPPPEPSPLMASPARTEGRVRVGPAGAQSTPSSSTSPLEGESGVRGTLIHQFTDPLIS